MKVKRMNGTHVATPVPMKAAEPTLFASFVRFGPMCWHVIGLHENRADAEERANNYAHESDHVTAWSVVEIGGLPIEKPTDEVEP